MTDSPVDLTPDGHHVVINGRHWRATDPLIPEADAARLRKTLMAARRDVGAALKAENSTAERASARPRAGGEGRTRRARHPVVGPVG